MQKLFISLTLFLSANAFASVDLTRRGFLLGSASFAAISKWPCSQLVTSIEEVPAAMAVRSKLFAEALRFWPKWASELDPSQPHFFPAFQLIVHKNPLFVALSRAERFSLVEKHLLKREKFIERSLAEIPVKVAARTGMPIDKARNLTRLFLEDTMIPNHTNYMWLRYHQEFFMAALNELEQIEPDFGRMYRLAIETFNRTLDDQKLPKSHLRLNLQDGSDDLYRIQARVMEFTDDWKTVMQAGQAIFAHWRFHIFPGYNRYGHLSDMRKSKVGLESLNRFLANDLPKLNIAEIKEPPRLVPDPEMPGWGKVPALDRFPVRKAIEAIKVESRLRIEAERLRVLAEHKIRNAISEEEMRILLSPIQSELDELKELIEAPVLKPPPPEPEVETKSEPEPEIELLTKD